MLRIFQEGNDPLNSEELKDQIKFEYPGCMAVKKQSAFHYRQSQHRESIVSLFVWVMGVERPKSKYIRCEVLKETSRS